MQNQTLHAVLFLYKKVLKKDSDLRVDAVRAKKCEISLTGAFRFCDRLCNYGMIIKTEPKASRLGTNLIACNVERRGFQ